MVGAARLPLGAGVVMAMAMAAGCSKEPSFDERYERAASQIEARAKALDEAATKDELENAPDIQQEPVAENPV